jgi:hypothetical protein
MNNFKQGMKNSRPNQTLDAERTTFCVKCKVYFPPALSQHYPAPFICFVLF